MSQYLPDGGPQAQASCQRVSFHGVSFHGVSMRSVQRVMLSLCRWRFAPGLLHSVPSVSSAIVKQVQNFLWFLQGRTLSVQGASTSHSVLETEGTCQTQAWLEGQGRAGCKQRLQQSRVFLVWGSSRMGEHGSGQS